MAERESFESDYKLQAIEQEIDEMVVRMQTPDSKRSIDRFFNGTPKELQESIRIHRARVENESPTESA